MLLILFSAACMVDIRRGSPVVSVSPPFPAVSLFTKYFRNSDPIPK